MKRGYPDSNNIEKISVSRNFNTNSRKRQRGVIAPVPPLKRKHEDSHTKTPKRVKKEHYIDFTGFS